MLFSTPAVHSLLSFLTSVEETLVAFLAQRACCEVQHIAIVTHETNIPEFFHVIKKDCVTSFLTATALEQYHGTLL